jgi:hypothetical protein
MGRQLHMSTQAVRSLEAALMAAGRKYMKMTTDDVLSAAVDLADESGIEFDKTETIVAVLQRVATLGSIDAVAIMVALGCSQESCAEALRGVSERSSDVMEGMLVEGLTTVVEEWLEGEVAAGRMRKTICPETKQPLYWTVEEKK